jgi:MFS family permease
MAYLTAQYFGLKRYGVAFGIIIGFYSVGFGLAPVLAGAVFDALGTYASVLWIMLVGLGVSALLAALLGEPPEFKVTPTALAKRDAREELPTNRTLAHGPVPTVPP